MQVSTNSSKLSEIWGGFSRIQLAWKSVPGWTVSERAWFFAFRGLVGQKQNYARQLEFAHDNEQQGCLRVRRILKMNSSFSGFFCLLYQLSSTYAVTLWVGIINGGSNIEPRLKGILWLSSQAQTKARTPELWRQHHVIPWQPYTQLCTCHVEESLLE